MKFNYQARDKDGQIQAGVLDAPSKESALRLLERTGLYITLLKKSEDTPFYQKKIELFNKVSVKDIVLFTRQLAIMFTSRVSLVESLKTISSQINNKAFQEKIIAMSEDVEGGSSFSAALAKHPDTFSLFYVNIVKSGETSGELSKSLDNLAEHLERDYHLTSKIKGAMIYPAFVLVVAALVIFLMSFFVMPNISKVIQETGQELPLMTKIVIGGADFFRAWGWLFLLVFLGIGIAIFQYIKTADGKKIYHKILLKVPVINAFLKMVYLSRFAENLATLVSGGIPIAESLTITGDIVGNETYKAVILESKAGVQKGESISSVLRQHAALFPPVFTEMIRAGEKSGALDKTLLSISEFYQKEVDRTVDIFLSLLEPVMIVGLGVFVGGTMAAVLLPLYQISSL